MTQERRAHTSPAETERPAGRPSLEDQQFHLLDIQLKQGHDLESHGLADKVRADLMERARRSRARLDASEYGGSIEVDLDVDLKKDTDLTRVVAALDTKKDGNARFAGVRFTTVKTDDTGKTWEDKAFVPVAMGSLEAGWGNFVPVAGYTSEDAALVTGMLQTVLEDREQGALPDVADDLASVIKPWDGGADMSPTPPIMPRF